MLTDLNYQLAHRKTHEGSIINLIDAMFLPTLNTSALFPESFILKLNWQVF